VLTLTKSTEYYVTDLARDNSTGLKFTLVGPGQQWTFAISKEALHDKAWLRNEHTDPDLLTMFKKYETDVIACAVNLSSLINSPSPIFIDTHTLNT